VIFVGSGRLWNYGTIEAIRIWKILLDSHGRGEKCSDKRVRTSLSARMSQNHSNPYTSKLHEVFCIVPVAVALSCSAGNAVCYVLSILWMTSRLRPQWAIWRAAILKSDSPGGSTL